MPDENKIRRPYESVYSRLRRLPEVFSISDVKVEFDMSDNTAWTSCKRWQQHGFIVSAGPRCGLYFNLIAAPDGPQRLLGEVIQRIDPSAVVIGASALRWHNWTTQIAREYDIAVPYNRAISSRPQIHGESWSVRWWTRPRAWYESIYGKHRPGALGLPTLDPEYAVADCWVGYGGPGTGANLIGRWERPWRADPDDLDPPDNAYQKINDALIHFGEARQEAGRMVNEIIRMKRRDFGRGPDEASQNQFDF